MKKLKTNPFLLAAAVFFLFFSCKKEEKVENLKIQDQADELPHQSIITPDPAAETKKYPMTSLALSEPNFNFGKIEHGKVVEHTFEVTNTGKNPLILSSVKPGCGCTVPDFTKEPILPGKKGKVNLKFNSESFSGVVHKTAEIYANVEKTPITIGFTADIQVKK